MNAAAAAIIARLGLAPLPVEGGYFRRTWTGPARSPDGRSAGTAIYFLITDDDFSAFHRLKTDEVWCFNAGDPVEHIQLVPGETAPWVSMLGDVASGFAGQIVVPGGVWQGARLGRQPTHGWALLTCFMAPGWDQAEFEPGGRAALQREFPGAAAIVAALTR